MNAPRQEVLDIFQTSTEAFNTQLQELCDLLQSTLKHYTWVGFYFANTETRTLHLGPCCGAPTDHTCIPFGKGICGQVAESNNPFLVPDVSAQDNYIACSLTVKSELVVPLFVQGKNIGQIDIDSEQIDAFDQGDIEFLEWVNAQIAQAWPEDYNPIEIYG
ncbi:GAF domain-containing protein [Flavobacteriaceae bacterium]|nr:GAF domain-containing protein [Flavobacteriaceae bacterium]